MPMARITRSTVSSSLLPPTLDRGGDAVLALLQRLYGGVGADLDPALLERLPREGRDLLVLHRQDPRQHLDHGHLGAHGAVEARELDADGARAHHQERLRHAFRDHRLLVGPDQLAVGLEALELAGAGAGRQDDVLGLDRLVAALVELDRELALSREPAVPVDHGDLVLLEQVADAAVRAARQACGCA